MKTEPETFSINDLKRLGKSGWDGVRNYQARNLMRDQMQVGDLILFYHSNANPPGIAGLAKVSQTGLPDPSQWDAQSPYYDPKSTPENPRWIMVEISYMETFSQFISLETLKQIPALQGLMVIQKGARLSVQPVSAEHFEYILSLAQAKNRK